MPEPLTHADWLAGVPAHLTATAASWGLTPGRGYPPGAAGHAVRAELPDGTPAVLKLANPSGGSDYWDARIDTVCWLLEAA